MSKPIVVVPEELLLIRPYTHVFAEEFASILHSHVQVGIEEALKKAGFSGQLDFLSNHMANGALSVALLPVVAAVDDHQTGEQS